VFQKYIIDLAHKLLFEKYLSSKYFSSQYLKIVLLRNRNFSPASFPFNGQAKQQGLGPMLSTFTGVFTDFLVHKDCIYLWILS
jgi:hypothetical protein